MHGLRVARSLFLLSVPLYAWIAEKNAPVGKFRDPQLRTAIYLVGVVLVLTIFRIRSRELNRAKDQSSRVAVDPAAARRWRAVQLLLLGCSEGVALYGLVIRFLGGTFAQALPLYIAGFLLLLYFVPRELSETLQEH
jgi:hypothetical protein